jgi:uncharacterized Zn-finger protein
MSISFILRFIIKSMSGEEDSSEEVLQPLNSSFVEVDVEPVCDENNNSGNFKCEICPKSYKQKRSLNRHIKLHRANFKCKQCTLTFEEECDLNMHNMTLHSKKNFLCSVCGNSYTRKSSLEEHSKIHEGTLLKCPVGGCDKQFTRTKGLADHLNFHTQIKHIHAKLAEKNTEAKKVCKCIVPHVY